MNPTRTSASNTTDPGVVINGVKWATRNVAEHGKFADVKWAVAGPGTFAAKPEDAGLFYQWNRRIAWPTTGEVSNWEDTNSTGTTWEKTNDPSPLGWRVPTCTEIETLFDTDKVRSEWTVVNGINGRQFTDKETGNSIFLPAAGFRRDRKNLWDAGNSGYYWSSTQIDSSIASTAKLSARKIKKLIKRDRYCAYYLYFDSNGADWNEAARSFGFSVRPVAE